LSFPSECLAFQIKHKQFLRIRCQQTQTEHMKATSEQMLQNYYAMHNLLRHNAVQSVYELTFRRNVLPPSSASKISLARNDRTAGG
jgi:hypothetical protein